MTAHDSALDPAEPQPAAQPHAPSPSQAPETASDPATVEAAPSSPERASTSQADAPEGPSGRSTVEAQTAVVAPDAPASEREPGGEPSALAPGASSEQTPTPVGEQRTEEVPVPRPAPTQPPAAPNPFAPPSAFRSTTTAPLSPVAPGARPAAPGPVPPPGPHDTRPYGAPLGTLPVARPGLPGYAPQPPAGQHPYAAAYQHATATPGGPAQHGTTPPQPAYQGAGSLPGEPDPHGSTTPVEPWGAPPPPPAQKPRRRIGAGAVAGIAALALVAGAVGGIAADRIVDGTQRRPVSASLPLAGTAPEAERPAGSVAAIAATVLPSVVSLQVEGADGISTGSGFVIREDGYILTNNHVVAGGADGGKVTVLFADGSERPATIVGRTADYDLAVVKVDEAGLTPLVLGDSDAVVVGDPVVAIGAPLGLNGTVTTGIVSALNRPVAAGDSAETAFINAIQTDAAINPGNSGGPLVNGAGEVVGVNSAIAQPPGTGGATGSIGLGFAIPSDQARRTAEELIEKGTATYPVIGVLLDSRYQGEGVQVTTEPQGGQSPVTAGGPADEAGIQAGDVILAIDGRPVSLSDELIVAIRAKAPGDTVTLRVRTGDAERDVRVVLDEATSE
ncbi:S1C family serine protease [Oerskovia enterophila]|uniref:Periplasmic serine endoprotease DegP-like n=1 Tax=Oerskovia enterophila TaxID=43678 RepID=A0ABX2Y5A5_9CELL|nr:trypsin-like peptidase domain-containing protein [Oerskovia enterophila]OCI31724.1 putative periplasmic serine endoprotease DegP-like precursor [Oerskovia enterophila]